MAIQSGRILGGALDRIVCSSANYWAAMLSDLAAALAFLALGLHRFSGPWVVAGGVVIAGFMSLGLLDRVHPASVGPARPTLHGQARSHATPRRAQSAHQHAALRHHDRGAGNLGAARARASGRGRRSAGLRAVGRLRRAPLTTPIAATTSRASPTCDDERLHHHRQVVNFGISTTMWDRLFGTFQPTV